MYTDQMTCELVQVFKINFRFKVTCLSKLNNEKVLMSLLMGYILHKFIAFYYINSHQ